MARELQPSVVFIDEIDSLLSTRAAGEHDASRRIKNEFFVQMDGVSSSTEDRILILGATNLPFDLDEAIVRRLEKRVFVPLPDKQARMYLIQRLVQPHRNSLTSSDIDAIAGKTEGYSGSDLKSLCKEAAMGPLRCLGTALKTATLDDIRPISTEDFEDAIKRIRPSVSLATLTRLEEWNKLFCYQG